MNMTQNIPIWMSAPFVIMLAAIAFAHFINKKLWEKYYAHFSIAIGIATSVTYYLLFKNSSRLVHTAAEYFSFICLLGSLFVVAGGIVIHVRGKGTPLANSIMLVIGAIVSNVIGTTGASMLLIRPFLRMNKFRMRPYLVVFFIFVVGNIGGLLTPIGDPPLFLGYLKGVPFFWVIKNVWHIWAFAVLLVVAIFFVIDGLNKSDDDFSLGHQRFQLLGRRNFLFLVLILVSVFAPTPWRELLMIAAAIGSYYATPNNIHVENEFNFHPIREVAILFFGIFATMMPALDWLEQNAKLMGQSTAGSYYWATGLLSSFLDNAPTYLSFLSAAMGLTSLDVTGLVTQAPKYIIAISVGAVFFGATTYIGNGPNFMVKSIAEHAKIKCPSFLGYIFCYSLPILLPIFILVWYIFI